MKKAIKSKIEMTAALLAIVVAGSGITCEACSPLNTNVQENENNSQKLTIADFLVNFFNGDYLVALDALSQNGHDLKFWTMALQVLRQASPECLLAFVDLYIRSNIKEKNTAIVLFCYVNSRRKKMKMNTEHR